MLRIFAWVAFIAVVVALAPAQAQQQTRVALVIGNGAYYTNSRMVRLPNPPNDAQDMAAALRALNFTVYDYTDLAADAMFDALDRFRIPALTADIALVFYSGHGMRDGDETYLLAIDAAPTRASQLPRHALTLTQVLETLEGAPGLKAVILDSCRDVGLVAFLQRQEIAASQSATRSAAHVRAAEIGRGAGRPFVTYDTLVAFATAPGEVALDGQGGRNSPFTTALLRHLTDHEEIGFVFRSVRQAVMNATGGRQFPEVLNAIGDRKYFLAGAPQISHTAPVQHPNDPCAAAPARPGFRCAVWNGFPTYERVAAAPQVRSAAPVQPTPAPARDPCAGLSSPGWECVASNGRPTWRRETIAPPVQQTPASIATASAQSTAAERARRRYACRTESGAQGVSFAEKCWPLDTTKIRHNSIPYNVRREVSAVDPLSGLTGLQELDLRGTQVSSLAPLQGMTGLQKLDLHNTQVSDLTPLAALTRLRRLSLNNTQVSDLAPLQAMTRLQGLSLDDTQVSDLTPLQVMTGLQWLSLRSTQVNDLTPLQGITRLQGLSLYNTQVSDLTPLQDMARLQMIDLHNTQVSDLTPLQGLTELHLLATPAGRGHGGSDAPESRAAVARAIREWRPVE